MNKFTIHDKSNSYTAQGFYRLYLMSFLSLFHGETTGKRCPYTMLKATKGTLKGHQTGEKKQREVYGRKSSGNPAHVFCPRRRHQQKGIFKKTADKTP